MSEAKPNRAASKTSAIVDENLSSITYEAALTELESIIARIESGDVALEESLRQYRRGAALVRRCREVLDGARAEIERIAAGDDPPDGRDRRVVVDVEQRHLLHLHSTDVARLWSRCGSVEMQMRCNYSGQTWAGLWQTWS